MSSRIVRKEIKERIKALCLTVPNEEAGVSGEIPFYETLNGDKDPSKEKEWITAAFAATGGESVAQKNGASNLETGECNLYIFTKTGIGEDRALEIAEYFQKSFMASPSDENNPTGTVIESVDPPDEAYEGDTRKWFSVYVGLSYYREISV